ncbi:hypothetical protein DYB32_000381 [Aphanomyces invadans]|uniref:Uncharacterized protein n=1 Tax=Aphanomyces invadans TaxID=157072 RepID=A0A418BAB1_9STRA|nr:hypothetical protein DYB32_000381 [Aphanomyces invadans]
MWQAFVIGFLLALTGAAGVYCLHQVKAPVHELYQPSPSIFLLGYRAFLVGLFGVALFGYNTLPRAWLYYTVWNLTLQFIYLVWATVHQFRHRHETGTAIPSTRESRALNALFDVCFAVSLLVCAVYWGVVYPSRIDKTTRLMTVFQHGINCIFLVGEFVLNGFVVRKASLGPIVILPVLYGTFAWISHETWNYGLWPYKFLDMSSQASPVWYVGTFLSHPLLLFGAIGLSSLKSRSRPALVPVAYDPDLVATPKENEV